MCTLHVCPEWLNLWLPWNPPMTQILSLAWGLESWYSKCGPRNHSISNAATAAKSLQSCPTLCDPIDGSPPGSTIPGNLQARTLEWVAISFSNAWKWKNKVKSLSHVRLPATPWTAALQAPPSMGFSRQEYWSGVPLPSPSISNTWELFRNISWQAPPQTQWITNFKVWD